MVLRTALRPAPLRKRETGEPLSPLRLVRKDLRQFPLYSVHCFHVSSSGRREKHKDIKIESEEGLRLEDCTHRAVDRVAREDAIRIRRALIAAIAAIRRFIERRQGNAPGFLDRVVESQKGRR